MGLLDKRRLAKGALTEGGLPKLRRWALHYLGPLLLVVDGLLLHHYLLLECLLLLGYSLLLRIQACLCAEQLLTLHLDLSLLVDHQLSLIVYSLMPHAMLHVHPMGPVWGGAGWRLGHGVVGAHRILGRIR